MIGEQLFISTVFIAGFLSFFAPCTFPLIPVYIGILTDKIGVNKFTPMIKTLLFVGGLSTSFMLLGFGAGVFGTLINGRIFIVVSGFIVVLLGLHQMGLFKLKALEKYKVLKFKRTQKDDFLGTYLLGITFSFGWTPCVGPVLGAVLVLSAGGGSPFYGVWLMMIYGLGLMVPFLIMALLSEYLVEKFFKIEKYLPTIKKIGGAMIVLMGILLMTENLMDFTLFLENLF